MASDRIARLGPVPAAASGPAGRLLADLPAGWHGDVIGPGIEGWESVGESGRDRSLHLEGLPGRLRLEVAWMAHWQHLDGLKVQHARLAAGLGIRHGARAAAIAGPGG